MRSHDVDIWLIAKSYLMDRRWSISETDYQLLLGHIRARSWRDLIQAFRDYGPEYRRTEECRTLAQLSAFFKKNVDFASRKKCEAEAVKKFEQAEAQCRRTNKRIDHFSKYDHRLPPVMQRALPRMREYIARVLGPPEKMLAEMPNRIKITSGATSSSPRSRAQRHMKVSKRNVAYPGTVPYLTALSSFYGAGQWVGKIETSNRVVFVPKTSLIYRSIAAEASSTLPVQLAIGGYIADRLVPYGINLKDQSKNQSMAKIGSCIGTWCTIDLASASDTQAYNLVFWLLPDEWVPHLVRNRAQSYVLPGDPTIRRYAKFSSMGNGFTFPLETLIFCSMCWAVGSRGFSVYGDDIIIERRYAEELLRVLKFCGFTPNRDKSFLEGPFRESCGADYHKGVNVRAFYVESTTALQAPDLCHLINGLVSLNCKRLNKLCAGWQERFRLPLVPVNGDTRSGVFISPTEAWDRGLIKDKKTRVANLKKGPNERPFIYVTTQIWVFSGYVSTTPQKRKRDIRAYLLWFLDKNRVGGGIHETSLVPKHVKVRVRKSPWVSLGTVPPSVYYFDRFIR